MDETEGCGRPEVIPGASYLYPHFTEGQSGSWKRELLGWFLKNY